MSENELYYHRYFANTYGQFVGPYDHAHKIAVLFDAKTNEIIITVHDANDKQLLNMVIQSDENQNLTNDEWLAIVQLMNAIENR